jgi:ureidoglycolate lyase
MTSTIRSSDNQCGLDLTRPPSTRDVRVFDVPLLRATDSNLAGFGRMVRDFASAGCDITPFPLSGWRRLVEGTGDEGGVVEDVFELARVGRVQFAVNVGLGRKYVTGWYGSDPAEAEDTKDPADELVPGLFDSILTHEANYHPDGGQVFSSRGAPFVLLLARPGDDVAPASFRAFFVDPADGFSGVHISAGVWHQPAFPAAGGGGAASTLDNRQGKVHGCVAVDFVREFGGYLRVPLSRDAILRADDIPPAPSPAAPRLALTVLRVANVERAIAFYEAAFGCRRRFLAAGGAYGELETGAAVLAFAASDEAGVNAPPHSLVRVRIEVADPSAALPRALAAGAQLASADASSLMIVVRDCNGFVVEIAGFGGGGL